MDHTNKTWRFEKSFNRFACDASDINLPPGVWPSPNTVRDPWERRGPAFVDRRDRENDVTHWSANVQAPDGTWVTLVIYND